jgi:hypothetical protein
MSMGVRTIDQTVRETVAGMLPSVAPLPSGADQLINQVIRELEARENALVEMLIERAEKEGLDSIAVDDAFLSVGLGTRPASPTSTPRSRLTGLPDTSESTAHKAVLRRRFSEDLDRLVAEAKELFNI